MTSDDAGTLEVEVARCRAILDGVVIEHDGMLVRIDDWPKLVAATPSLADWRILRFPISGWLVALEPAHVVNARYRESLRKAQSPS